MRPRRNAATPSFSFRHCPSGSPRFPHARSAIVLQRVIPPSRTVRLARSADSRPRADYYDLAFVAAWRGREQLRDSGVPVLRGQVVAGV